LGEKTLSTLECYESPEISFDFTLNRRKGRRNVSVKVDPSNQVFVQVPWQFAKKDLSNVLHQNVTWIVKQLASNEVKGVYQPKQFMHGERFLFVGEEYRLCIVPDSKYSEITLEGYNLILPMTSFPDETQESIYISQKIVTWYKNEALSHLNQRIEHYASILGRYPKDVKVRTAKHRWGSCSGLGVINFNWKIMMAPREVIDYLVVHELCHLVHANHSQRFWHCVESVMPDYLSAKKWLKAEEYRLELF
jgi:predicted metal-dependent hydrolase